MTQILVLRGFWWLTIPILFMSGHTMFEAGKSSDALDVRTQLVSPGSKFLGQPFEIQVSVNAGDQRPRLELPIALGAELAIVNTGLQPVGMSQIGSFTSQENRFLTRIRVIPRRVGPLVVPPLRASVSGRSGRSQPLKVTIIHVPPDGRPAEFLGGIGGFSVDTGVSASAMRIGQEFEFRVDVAGPAAAGMTDAPSLEEYRRLAVAPSVQLVSNQGTIEPLARTFLYRLRPTMAGAVVLPPVRIAAFDPASHRYLTRATKGVAIRVLAVPPFDPSTLADVLPISGGVGSRGSRIMFMAACATVVVLILAGIVWLRRFRVRESLDNADRLGRELATQVAGKLAKAKLSGASMSQTGEVLDESLAVRQWSTTVAREVTDGLIRYLELTAKRPPGALTPDEAALGIEEFTGSAALGTHARNVVALCDGVRFRLESPLLEEHTQQMIDHARALFRLLSEQRWAKRRERLLRPSSQAPAGTINGEPSLVSETPRY